MTRKTGKALQRARQQMRTAKIVRAKQELAKSGVSLVFKRPPAHVLKEKGEELRKLYLELYPERTGEVSEEEGWQTVEEIPETEESTKPHEAG